MQLAGATVISSGESWDSATFRLLEGELAGLEIKVREIQAAATSTEPSVKARTAKA